MSKTLWITYSWDDNKSQEVEYIAQQIEGRGVNVKLDRWNINAGRRLWEQIDKFISDSSESDAWAIYATENSLKSEACKEEIATALERALSSRGKVFPLIGIFPYGIAKELIPSPIKTRLYVSIEDNNWLERVVSTVNGDVLNIPRPQLSPVIFDITKNRVGISIIKVAPRVEVWDQIHFGIPNNENDGVKLRAELGSKNSWPLGDSMAWGEWGNYASADGEWWFENFKGNANSNSAFYFHFKKLPSKVLFFRAVNTPIYIADLAQYPTLGIPELMIIS